MDGAFGQMSNETCASQYDVGCRLIIRQHRDHGFSVARCGDAGYLACAEADEPSGSTGTAVEYADIVSGFCEVGCHVATHMAKADKSKFHRILSVSVWHHARCGGAMNSGPTGSTTAMFTMRSISSRSALSSDQPATPTAACT